MTELSIRIDSKAYGPTGDKPTGDPVLLNLNLTAREGEFICLVGPSGCGKTTLLNILAGLDKDYIGHIGLGSDGRHPRLGYVFQNPRLLPWRTVEENILLALPKGYEPAYVDHLLSAMGLASSRHDYPERLSLGMSRRVSLIRAFAVNPDLLLMDEPFVSLDPPTARRIRELLIRLWLERPHTVLFVTHDLREAIELADRLVFLSASPTSVVCEVTLDLPRKQRDPDQTEQIRQRLMKEHPQLNGLL